jgi:hypothetical protein
MHLRKFAAQRVASCLAAFAAVTFVTLSAAAQVTYKPHETNASREARIQRSIHETYSHRWEVFGGGGFLRFRSGEYTQKNNEIAWIAQTHYFLNPKLSVVADARGMFGNGKPLRNEYITQNPNPQINEYTLTGGASYRFYAQQHFALSAQALGGMAEGNLSGASKGLNYQQTGFWQDAWRPAVIGSVSADVNIYPNLALRISPTYVGTTFTSPSGGTLQSNWGINAGFVFRFGRQ